MPILTTTAITGITFTADYGFSKVGLGLSVLNDKARLQRQTRVVGTYAYHLPLSESQNLHFGVSFGFMNRREVADVATFYSAISYKIKLTDGNEGIGIEPKVALRGVKGLDNMWDAGAQLTLVDEQILLLGLYHSTESATFGLGMNYKKKYLISGMYTTETSSLTGYSNGTFELSLRVFLSSKLQ